MPRRGTPRKKCVTLRVERSPENVYSTSSRPSTNPPFEVYFTPTASPNRQGTPTRDTPTDGRPDGVLFGPGPLRLRRTDKGPSNWVSSLSRTPSSLQTLQPSHELSWPPPPSPYTLPQGRPPKHLSCPTPMTQDVMTGSWGPSGQSQVELEFLQKV